jgi:hypothetical protein
MCGWEDKVDFRLILEDQVLHFSVSLICAQGMFEKLDVMQVVSR